MQITQRPRAFQCMLIISQSGSVKGNELIQTILRHFQWSFTAKEFAKTYLISSNGVQVQLELEFFETFHVWRTPRLRNLIWNSIINHNVGTWMHGACTFNENFFMKFLESSLTTWPRRRVECLSRLKNLKNVSH